MLNISLIVTLNVLIKNKKNSVYQRVRSSMVEVTKECWVQIKAIPY